MKQSRFWGSIITLIAMMTSLFIPIAASAQSANPYDESFNNFLEEMDLSFQPGDSVWSDPQFVEFYEMYEELEALNMEFNQIIAELGLQFLALFDQMLIIEDSGFQQQLGTTETDIQELETLKSDLAEIIADLQSGENQDLLSNFTFIFFFLGFLDGLNDTLDEDFYSDEEFYSDANSIYAWADTGEAVDAGKLVRLNSAALNFEGTELTYEWTQTYGPEVMHWMNTDYESDIAFIVPEYDVLGDQTYMEFQVTVTDEYGNEASDIVWVDLIMG